MIEIRYVKNTDKKFWYSLDHHLPETEFDNKVKLQRGYVLLLDGVPLGILRYNLFFDSIPFCTMLFIEKKYQRKGYVKQLIQYWENDMKVQGYELIMTSTQVDEDAQHFYRKLGYKDCGGIIFDTFQFRQPMELFLLKSIMNTG